MMDNHEEVKMKKIWLIVIGLVVVVMGLMGLASCGTETAAVSPNGQQTGLWVNGEGKIEVTPDVAILTLGIEAQETSVAVAQEKAAEAMAKVIQALKDQGIEDKDIQTQYFSINQITNWTDNKEQITGYRVTNTVTVKVRAVAKAGDAIDAVVAAGGDLARVNGITFTVDEPANYYVDARALAIEHATNKAKQMADKAGFKLGKITYITENSGSYGINYRNYVGMNDSAMGAPAASTPVSIGSLEITATVNIAYEIK
jgi:uncharacterized protein